MISGLVNVPGGHLFVGKHPLNVEISCTGDQILFISVFRGQTICNQMTAVIQVIPVNNAGIFYRMPAGWFYFSDWAAFFGWHSVFAHVCISYAAAAKFIQLVVGFEGISLFFFLRSKIWFIAIHFDGGVSVIFRYIFDRKAGFLACGCLSCDCTFRNARIVAHCRNRYKGNGKCQQNSQDRCP